MVVLSIETSCDETAAAVVSYENDGRIIVRSSVVSSQIALHSQWGGVVPNLAAREHTKNIFPVIESALKESKTELKNIDIIAVTAGPGLIPALLVGTTAARTISYFSQKPILPIHHIAGHIAASFIGKNPDEFEYPILSLVVSGGHTQLMLLEDPKKQKIIGQTRDDAVGEAFDKVARILSLGYPGGPAVSSRAEKARNEKREAIDLPRPMIKSKNNDFSFSGLKTAVLYVVRNFRAKNKLDQDDPLPSDFTDVICLSFENAAVDVLVSKTVRVAKELAPRGIILAGGVSANSHLRNELRNYILEATPELPFIVPEMQYTLDNAAMIGAAAIMKWKSISEKDRAEAKFNWSALRTGANMVL